MSYILDALRKADAERERGNVPGIHAQPMFAGAPQSAQSASSRPWVFVLAGAAVVLLAVVAVLVWLLAGSTKTAPVNVASSGSVGSTGVEPSAGSMVPSGTAPAMASGTPPAPVAAPTAAAAKPVPSVMPGPVTGSTSGASASATSAAPAAISKTAHEPAALARKPKPATAAASTQATSANGAPTPPTATASAASPEARIYTITELPDEIRRSLPSIVVGGSVYSPVPANRFLFINGQVMHEGDVVSPGVVLQQIKLKAAVLLYKGYRYEMNY